MVERGREGERGEREGEGEPGFAGHRGDGLSLSLEVFAHTNCVCFGPERNTAVVPSPYFSGYFYRTL